jgi:uncharacterized membrane protein
MKSPFLAGLVAAIPLAVILIVYTLIRGKALAAFFRAQDETFARIPEGRWPIILLAGCAAMAFLFGGVAGLVYGKVGAPRL